MSLWDALETPLAEQPLFHIDERDREPASEFARQCELVKRLRGAGLHVMAIPNARAWGMKAWNRAKAEGVEWGAADLVVNGPGRLTAFIEMKNGREMPEQHQIDWLNARHRLGLPVGVFRRANSAVAWLREQGFPIRTKELTQ
jgi:hypothetical protein